MQHHRMVNHANTQSCTLHLCRHTSTRVDLFTCRLDKFDVGVELWNLHHGQSPLCLVRVEEHCSCHITSRSRLTGGTR